MSAIAGGGIGWNTRGVLWAPAVQGGMRPAPAVTTPWPNLGRFRRHITWTMTDLLAVPIVGATVLFFDWTTKLLAAQLTTDSAGVADFPVYAEGTTYFLYGNKAGTPEVFGATSSQVTPV